MAVGKILAAFKRSPAGMRLKELRHRFVLGRRYKRMIQASERFALCRERKPAAQRRREIRLCRSYWGCYPLHYLRHNLYRRDCSLSEAEIVDFVPEFFFFQLFLPYYDSKKYEILLADKNVTELVFRASGIAQPPTLAKLVGRRLYAADGGPTDVRQLMDLLGERRPQKVFVKPTDGLGGYGIHVFHPDERGGYRTREGGLLDEDFLARIGRERDYLLQPGLEQDPQLSEIYPHSVNTFRVLTENRGPEPRVLCATLRIGRCGREVDNSAQDNIVLPLDIATGQTGAVAITETGERFDRHPDTGFRFAGARIRRWDEVCTFTAAAARRLPQFTYLGWDIALTREGPLAIETNLDFGLDHYQAVLGGLRPILGIDDPGFYWKNRGKR